MVLHQRFQRIGSCHDAVDGCHDVFGFIGRNVSVTHFFLRDVLVQQYKINRRQKYKRQQKRESDGCYFPFLCLRFSVICHHRPLSALLRGVYCLLPSTFPLSEMGFLAVKLCIKWIKQINRVYRGDNICVYYTIERRHWEFGNIIRHICLSPFAGRVKKIVV